MDIELLFSTSPFVQQELGNFSYIVPNLTSTITLDPTKTVHTLGKRTILFSLILLELPEECKNTNVMVEFSSAELRKVKPHFSHNLYVRIEDDEGSCISS